MYILKKSVRLDEVPMMTKDYGLMMGLQHILMDTRAGKVSSIQNTYFRKLWIKRNKCIIKFNKKSGRY